MSWPSPTRSFHPLPPFFPPSPSYSLPPYPSILLPPTCSPVPPSCWPLPLPRFFSPPPAQYLTCCSGSFTFIALYHLHSCPFPRRHPPVAPPPHLLNIRHAAQNGPEALPSYLYCKVSHTHPGMHFSLPACPSSGFSHRQPPCYLLNTRHAVHIYVHHLIPLAP